MSLLKICLWKTRAPSYMLTTWCGNRENWDGLQDWGVETVLAPSASVHFKNTSCSLVVILKLKWLLWSAQIHWATLKNKHPSSPCYVTGVNALQSCYRHRDFLPSTCLKALPLQHRQTDFKRKLSQSSYIIYTSNVQFSFKKCLCTK